MIAVVDEIPKGPTGKLQRLGLAERLGLASGEGSAFTEPATVRERELAALWAELLGVERVGAHDDFFELGGDSLRAIELVARLRERYDRPALPLTVLIWAPTVAKLADELARKDAAPIPTAVAIQAGGDRPPFFLVHGLDGGVVGFATLARRLGPEQPFYGLRARGADGEAEPYADLDEMVSDYVRAVRAVQPHGPYRLGGMCVGAPIAVEVAERLAGAGEEIALLALVDPRVRARRGLHYWAWQLRLAGRKFRLGHYSWRLVLPSRQREIWAPLVSLVRRRYERLDTRPAAERRFDDRIRAIRRTMTARPYAGHIELFVSDDWPLRRWFWTPIARGGIEETPLPSRHVAIFRPPAVDALARRLAEALDESDRDPAL